MSRSPVDTKQISANRLFINNEQGQAVAAIISIEEYDLIKEVLEASQDDEAKLHELELAVQDSRFMADLEGIMADFTAVDAEWWEHR